jgi:hypothetical protein
VPDELGDTYEIQLVTEDISIWAISPSSRFDNAEDDDDDPDFMLFQLCWPYVKHLTAAFLSNFALALFDRRMSLTSAFRTTINTGQSLGDAAQGKERVLAFI